MSSAFAALDKDKDGLVTKKDFERSFTTLSSVQVAVFSKKCQAPTSLQVDACFKKFDKDKDGMLNFVEFKNFMGKRKSLPDKVTFAQVFLLRKFYNIWLQALARCTSTLSLRLLTCHPPSPKLPSGPFQLSRVPLLLGHAYCTTQLFCA